MNGTLKLLTQTSPLSWSSQTLASTPMGRPTFLVVKQRDGVSSVLLTMETFTTSPSNGDDDYSLLTLEETQLTRTVPIGHVYAQVTTLYPSFDVAGDGTAFLLRITPGSSSASPVSITRVDAVTGGITTLAAGSVVRGAYSRSTAIGVSAGGEIGILHMEDLWLLTLRRLIPR